MRVKLFLPGFEEVFFDGKGCYKFRDRVLSYYFGLSEIGVFDQDIDLMAADALI
jgi:hypothetical protein